MADKKDDKKKSDAPDEMTPMSPMSPMDATNDDMLNSTMMNIDEKGIDFDNTTRTEIRIKLPAEEESVSVYEQVEKRKPVVQQMASRFLGRFKNIKIGSVPDFTKSFSNTWICDSGESLIRMVFFYLSRIFILVASIYLHRLLIDQVSMVLKNDHPAGFFYTVVLLVDVVLVFVGLYFKGSPAWLFSLPLSALALIFSCGAWYFHTADPLFFNNDGMSLGDWLNTWYLILFVGVAFLTLSEVVQRLSSKIICLVLFLLCLTPFVINHFESVRMETAFFGTPLTDFIPGYFFQPQNLVLSVLVPLILIFFFVRSFGGATYSHDFISRGFARSFTFLFLIVVIANFSLMQKNRVFHVLNFFMPQKLDVGDVEIQALNQSFRIETSNFKQLAGDDRSPRYFMTLKPVKKNGQYLLQVVDQYDFPVKNLVKDDFVVFADNKPLKTFKFEEDKSLNLKRGHYILEVALTEKPSLISWDTKRTEYNDTDKIIFELQDVSKVKAMVIQEKDEKLLDMEFPREKSVEFPLSYFNPGKHLLEISLYDATDSEIFRKNLEIHVVSKSDFTILSPLDSDVLRNSAAFVVLPKSLQPSSITTSIFLVNGETVYEGLGAVLFYNLDLSRFTDGPLMVGAKFISGDKEFYHEVQIKKQTNVPKLLIHEPKMGIFSERQTDVAFGLDEGSGKIAGVKVLINGEEFKDFEIKDQKFTVPVFRWAQSEIYLAVQATLESGIKVSDWVQINKGSGVLDLGFDLKSLDFLNYKKVGLILDASISNLDSWQGKGKWKSLKKLITEPPVESKIRELDPGIFVLGARKPFYYKDCSDHEELMKSDQYNLSILKRKLNEINPLGVSPLYQALKKLDKTNPDKIFVFADSVGECDAAKLGKLGSVVSFFILGDIPANDKTKFQKIADQTSGRVYQPETYQILEQTLLEELVLSYEIYFDDQLVQRSPFEAKQFSLPPGKYTLKIPTLHDVKEMDFTLGNGANLKLTVMGEDGKVLIKETWSQL